MPPARPPSIFRFSAHTLVPIIRPYRSLASLAAMADPNPSKRLKPTPLRIGTHNGTFHADEALAVFLLRMTPEYKDSTLTRSRDPTVLEECDIIVDVQGIYDGTKHFDHHQRSFDETFSPEHTTKLSSAGLIYKHFARSIIAQSLDKPEDDASVELIYQKLYNDFIEAVDANDNGISAYPSDIKPSFNDRGVTLASLVFTLNPWWNHPITPEEEDARFLQATTLMGESFTRKLNFYTSAWLPARDILVSAFEKRFEYDPEGRILVLEHAIPWKEHLFTLESDTGIEESKGLLYVLFGEGAGKQSWRIQAVPVSKGGFATRKALPEAWRGFRDDQLSEVSEIPGCVFVHTSGFIGGNKSFEGALAMAKKALEL